MKQVTGPKKTPDGIVFKKTTGGMRKILCPHCRGFVVKQRDHKGRQVDKCASCGAMYKSTKL